MNHYIIAYVDQFLLEADLIINATNVGMQIINRFFHQDNLPLRQTMRKLLILFIS